MIDLKLRYDKLWSDSLLHVQQNNFQTDEHLHDPKDNRFGLTLLVRPDSAVSEKIQRFLTELKVIDPAPYYYPTSDLHITVLSIISCYAGFEVNKTEAQSYIDVINAALSKYPSFPITFSGVCISPSTVLLQGCYEAGTLDSLRDAIRNAFRQTDLKQSIDKRYRLSTAHSTVVRFSAPVARKKEFLDILQQYRAHNFGTINVKAVEFVHNDWYQRAEKTSLLAKFPLVNPQNVLRI